MTDYVSVHDEPMHRFRFRNEYAFVYDVRIPASAVTLYHSHDEDSLYVAINGVHCCTQDLGCDPVTSQIDKGTIMVAPFRSTPLIHQVTNIGDDEMRMIGAEILASPPVTAAAPLTAPGVTLLAEKPRIRTYKIELAPGETTGDMACDFSGILIVMAGGCIEIADGRTRRMSLAPGDAIWHDGPLTQRFTNPGSVPFEAVLGEWR
ncbi:hypothetical protein [Emcibacter sp. SYSU 3D8]|uniref:hypothetical protein n=1 Tax=Emcibacter sp. SYSU 3D8 TaxID=3133969 RepID=UPI0031FED58D